MVSLQTLKDAQIEECLERKGIEVCGEFIGSDEMFITYDVGGDDGKELEAACDGPILVILNTKADQNMLVFKHNKLTTTHIMTSFFYSNFSIRRF